MCPVDVCGTPAAQQPVKVAQQLGGLNEAGFLFNTECRRAVRLQLVCQLTQVADAHIHHGADSFQPVDRKCAL
jgi:hypothetical protein